MDRNGIVREVNLRGKAIGAEVQKLLKENHAIEVTLRNTGLYEYRTGMGGDEQGASISLTPKHAELNEMVRNLSTNFEPVYRYKPKKGFVGKDQVEITLIDIQVGNAPGQEKTTKTKVLIKLNIIE